LWTKRKASAPAPHLHSAPVFRKEPAENEVSLFNNTFPEAGAAGFDSSAKSKNTKKKDKPMAINVKPLGDRVLVEPAEEKEVKKGGIIIPDTAKEKPTEGIVIALGTGKTDDSGKKIPFEVKKGDRVLVTKYGGTEIKLDGKEYKILSSDDILAVIE
jgi:chaperonin GroES